LSLDLVVLLVRIALAAVFALAAAGKLADPARTRLTLAEFGVPGRLTPAGAIALPATELAAAALLVPAVTARWGALLALVLLLLFACAVAHSLRQGRRPACNCFGALHSAPVGPATLVRNLGLAALAGFVAAAGPGEGLGALDRGTVLTVLAALGAVLLLGLCWFTWQLFRQNGRLLTRVRALEEAIGAGGPPAPRIGGLPAGEPVPDLSLATPSGARRAVADLVGPGLPPVALVFSDPSCQACGELAAKLPDWRERLAGTLEPVLVTREAGPHVEAAAAQGVTVLVQEDREALFAFAVGAVPAAVVVDAEGRISGPTAIGPAAIEELLSPPSPPEREIVGMIKVRR
jgi:uncharacterized membrane protein YphA (DoxX/SURF4 family)